MTPRTIYRELTAAGLLLASYPLDWLAQRAEMVERQRIGDAIVMAHGFGGGRANLLGLGTYLKMAGFTDLSYFEYPRSQPLSESVEKLGELVEDLSAGERAVHLIGHSFGGLIARRYARRAPAGVVRSLITLCSPYFYEQESPAEVAIFGEEDPLVPPPREDHLDKDAFDRVVVLRATGHLGVLYHPEALGLIENVLRSSTSAMD